MNRIFCDEYTDAKQYIFCRINFYMKCIKRSSAILTHHTKKFTTAGVSDWSQLFPFYLLRIFRISNDPANWVVILGQTYIRRHSVVIDCYLRCRLHMH